MRKLIEEHGMTIREFSEYYSIPYNTVRQWYNGIAKCPEYLKKLIKENRELKTKGKQLHITTGRIFNVLERQFTTQTDFQIYTGEKNWVFEHDKEFWENEEKKGGKYPVKVKTFQVQEIL